MRIHVSFDVDNQQEVAVGFEGMDAEHAADVGLDEAIEMLSDARSALASIRCALETPAPARGKEPPPPAKAPKAKKAKR